LSTDFEPDGSSREQNLAPDRGDRFSGTAPKAAAAAQDRRCLAFDRLDEAPHPSEPAREIPVEVMTESASPEERPAAPAEATRARSREPRQIPETEANPKPANEAMSGPNPVAKPAAPQPSATDGPQALAKPTRKDMARQQIGHEVRPAVRLPARTGTAMSFDLGPDSFRAVAVPLPAANGGEAMSYTLIVGGMLDRVKHYPETARQRDAKGIAIIGFALDESGGVASDSLLRSSGEADLDAESVALVRRAAPFPPPPPGAQHSFAIEVAFGMGS
jgi:TonB family protein